MRMNTERFLELLNKDPVNCGNCMHMKIRRIKYKGMYRMSAKCELDQIERAYTGWLIDNMATLPSTWQKAKKCEFRDLHDIRNEK